MEFEHRKRLSKALELEKESTRKAKVAGEVKNAFLANMSHDIRTPMNAIIGFSDIIAEHPDDEEIVKNAISKIQASGEILLKIINDVLDLSKIESGKAENVETVTDLKQMEENLKMMLGKDPNLQITSYRLIRRFLVEAMLKTNTYLPQIGNLLVLSSNRIINVPVQHAARAYGKSGYSFRRLVKDLIYDITAHTAFPLLMVRNIGIASFLVSFLLGIYYLVRYFLCGISVEGWTSLMLVMLAFFGLTLLSIGIIGIYLMNILNEAKKMPHYVIRQEETD